MPDELVPLKEEIRESVPMYDLFGEIFKVVEDESWELGDMIWIMKDDGKKANPPWPKEKLRKYNRLCDHLSCDYDM